MDVKNEPRSRIAGALAGASVPVASSEALLAAFPGAEQVADTILPRLLA